MTCYPIQSNRTIGSHGLKWMYHACVAYLIDHGRYGCACGRAAGLPAARGAAGDTGAHVAPVVSLPRRQRAHHRHRHMVGP